MSLYKQAKTAEAAESRFGMDAGNWEAVKAMSRQKGLLLS